MTKQMVADWAETGTNVKRKYVWLRMYHDEGTTTLKMSIDEAEEIIGYLKEEIEDLKK